MLFVIHALDRKDGINTRAKFYRAHRIHLDQAERYNVDVVTAGTLVADDGETPMGSVFVVDAKDRNAVDTFARSDPLPRELRLGDRANPRLQQEAGHPDSVAPQLRRKMVPQMEPPRLTNKWLRQSKARA